MSQEKKRRGSGDNNIYYTHRSWKQQALHLQDHMRETLRRSGDRSRVQGEFSVPTFIGVSEGKTRQARVNSLGLVRMNNFGRLWVVAVLPQLPGVQPQIS